MPMPKPFYLLTGEEFLSEEALDKIRAEADTDPLSEVMLDASAPAQHIIEALETGSLLGGIRLVVVASAQDLRKEHLEALERYLASPSETSVLVAIASGRNAKLTDLAKRTGAVVTLDAPKGRRLASWIKERGRAHNLKVDDRASWALIDAVGKSTGAWSWASVDVPEWWGWPLGVLVVAATVATFRSAGATVDLPGIGAAARGMNAK